jgi:P27 family predicted phage terminase small subunit
MPTPRKPDELHWLTGTKSQARPVEFTPSAGRPKKPKGVSKEALASFKRLCRLLESRRSLTPGDEDILRLFAVLFDRHARALTKLAEEGEIRVYVRFDSNGQAHDVEKTNMWLKIAQDAERQMVAILRDLGLTPNARAKVKPTAEAPAQGNVPGSYADLVERYAAQQAEEAKVADDSWSESLEASLKKMEEEEGKIQ